MRIVIKIVILCTLSIAASCSKQPAPTPDTQVSKTEEATTPKEPNSDCFLYLKFYEGDEVPIGLCMYSHTETRGIFASTACVVVLVEGQTNSRHPFYGSKGHWGIEGPCTKKQVEDKLKEKQTMTTMNPIYDLKMKRKQGKTVEILKDDFDIAQLLIQITDPTK